MSHEVETMAWANEVPWHRLGRRIGDDATPDQILRVADLDWNVSMKPVEWKNADGIYQQSDKYFSLVRDAHTRIDGEQIQEQVLTSGLTDQYIPIQNSRIAKFFDEYIKNGVATMETAMSLFNGRIVILVAKTNEKFELAGGDKIEQYLYCASYHTGRDQVKIRSSNTRVVCNNTFSASLRENAQVQGLISHRYDFTNSIEQQVKQDLGISIEQMKEFKEKTEFLATKKLKENDLLNYLLVVYQPELLKEKNFNVSKLMSDGYEFKPNMNVNRAYGAYHDTFEQNGKTYKLKNTGNDLKSCFDDTWWKAFNSVTYNEDHLRGGSTRDEFRTKRALLENNSVKSKALDVALELAA
jgi:phage/plasmid-like protein (TIGR03299 family)